MPKRDELLLRIDLALPKASSTGLVSMMRRARSFDFSTAAAVPFVSTPARQIRKSSSCLFVSVLPAPDSPETSSDCECACSTMYWYDMSATA